MIGSTICDNIAYLRIQFALDYCWYLIPGIGLVTTSLLEKGFRSSENISLEVINVVSMALFVHLIDAFGRKK